MPDGVRVEVDAFRILARDLKAAGRDDLKVEFKKEIQRFVRDAGIKENVAESARQTLPSGGGHVRKPPPRGRRKDGTPRKPRPRSARKGRTSPALNELIAKSKIKTVANFSGRWIGVHITGSQSRKGKSRNLEAINKGIVRRLTFGRGPWVVQKVKPGFFDAPLEGEVADEFRRHIFRAINNTRREILTGGSRKAA